MNDNSIYSGANIVQQDCKSGEASQEFLVESAPAQ
jgi:hypothetical protein